MMDHSLACLICDVSFPKNDLYGHVCKHFSFRRYSCRNCALNDNYSDVIVRHAIDAGHCANPKDFSLDKPFLHRLASLVLVQSRAAAIAGNAKILTDLEEQISLYQKDLIVPDDAQMQCLLCNLTFANTEIHVGLQHFDFLRFLCASCDFAAPFETFVAEHAIERDHDMTAIDASLQKPYLSRLVSLIVWQCRSAFIEQSTTKVLASLDGFISSYTFANLKSIGALSIACMPQADLSIQFPASDQSSAVSNEVLHSRSTSQSFDSSPQGDVVIVSPNDSTATTFSVASTEGIMLDSVACFLCRVRVAEDDLYGHVCEHFRLRPYRCASCDFNSWFSDVIVRHAIASDHCFRPMDAIFDKPFLRRIAKLVLVQSRAAANTDSSKILADLDQRISLYQKEVVVPDDALISCLLCDVSSVDAEIHVGLAHFRFLRFRCGGCDYVAPFEALVANHAMERGHDTNLIDNSVEKPYLRRIVSLIVWQCRQAFVERSSANAIALLDSLISSYGAANRKSIGALSVACAPHVDSNISASPSTQSSGESPQNQSSTFTSEAVASPQVEGIVASPSESTASAVSISSSEQELPVDPLSPSTEPGSAASDSAAGGNNPLNSGEVVFSVLGSNLSSSEHASEEERTMVEHSESAVISSSRSANGLAVDSSLLTPEAVKQDPETQEDSVVSSQVGGEIQSVVALQLPDASHNLSFEAREILHPIVDSREVESTALIDPATATGNATAERAPDVNGSLPAEQSQALNNSIEEECGQCDDDINNTTGSSLRLKLDDDCKPATPEVAEIEHDSLMEIDGAALDSQAGKEDTPAAESVVGNQDENQEGKGGPLNAAEEIGGKHESTCCQDTNSDNDAGLKDESGRAVQQAGAVSELSDQPTGGLVAERENESVLRDLAEGNGGHHELEEASLCAPGIQASNGSDLAKETAMATEENSFLSLVQGAEVVEKTPLFMGDDSHEVASSNGKPLPSQEAEEEASLDVPVEASAVQTPAAATPDRDRAGACNPTPNAARGLKARSDVCQRCQQAFPRSEFRSSTLQAAKRDHVWTAHGAGLPFRCGACDYAAGKLGNLQKHTKSHHPGVAVPQADPRSDEDRAKEANLFEECFPMQLSATPAAYVVSVVPPRESSEHEVSPGPDARVTRSGLRKRKNAVPSPENAKRMNLGQQTPQSSQQRRSQRVPSSSSPSKPGRKSAPMKSPEPKSTPAKTCMTASPKKASSSTSDKTESATKRNVSVSASPARKSSVSSKPSAAANRSAMPLLPLAPSTQSLLASTTRRKSESSACAPNKMQKLSAKEHACSLCNVETPDRETHIWEFHMDNNVRWTCAVCFGTSLQLATLKEACIHPEETIVKKHPKAIDRKYQFAFTRCFGEVPPDSNGAAAKPVPVAARPSLSSAAGPKTSAPATKTSPPAAKSSLPLAESPESPELVPVASVSATKSTNPHSIACDICKTTLKESSARRHVWSRHMDGLQPFICGVCNESDKRSWAAQEQRCHVKHSSQPPFKKEHSAEVLLQLQDMQRRCFPARYRASVSPTASGTSAEPTVKPLQNQFQQRPLLPAQQKRTIITAMTTQSMPPLLAPPKQQIIFAIQTKPVATPQAQCNLCSASVNASDASALMRHAVENHLKTESNTVFKCTVCAFTTNTFPNVRDHINTAHAGESRKHMISPSSNLVSGDFGQCYALCFPGLTHLLDDIKAPATASGPRPPPPLVAYKGPAIPAFNAGHGSLSLLAPPPMVPANPIGGSDAPSTSSAPTRHPIVDLTKEDNVGSAPGSPFLGFDDFDEDELFPSEARRPAVGSEEEVDANFAVLEGVCRDLDLPHDT